MFTARSWPLPAYWGKAFPRGTLAALFAMLRLENRDPCSRDAIGEAESDLGLAPNWPE